MQLNFYNKKERNYLRCDVCGKFIGQEDIKNKEVKFNFKPLDEFGPEEVSWTHIKCF